jgi:hypothetical protein
MRAHEFINEILSMNDPAPEASWHTSKDNGVSISKWVDSTGKEIKTTYQPNKQGGAAVDFTRDQVPAKDKVNAGGGLPSHKVTGTGGSATPNILSGVAQNLKTYFDNRPDINNLYFTSSDPSRTKAYSRMIDRLAPKAGLVGTRQSLANPNAPDFPTEFVLSRAQPGQQHVPLVAPKSATPPAAATKLPLPPGKAIPNTVINKAFTPSFAGSHNNSPNAQAFQDYQDFIKRKMPRI